jgi:mitogen-activated protein kinase 15
MLLGKPMFPGNSTLNQLERVLEVTGRPTPEDVASIRSPFAATMIDTLPPTRYKPLAEWFPSAPPDALDLIRRCLQFNPDKRLSAYEALRHPYVAAFHDEAQEPPCPRILRIQIDDNTKYSAADYRDRLYREIARRKAAAREARARREAARAGAPAGGAGSAPAAAASGGAGASASSSAASGVASAAGRA